MKRKLFTRLLLVSSLVFLLQCAPGGFKSQTAPLKDSSDTDIAKSPSDGTPDNSSEERKKELWNTINAATMTGMDTKISNTPNIDFDRKAGAYLLRIPIISFPEATFDMTFAEYPGLRLYVEFVSSKPYITLFIPVKYVLRNVTEVPAKLPNGDPVPLFPSGEPPSKGILLTPNKERKVYLYLSAEAFGVFVESNFDPTNVGGISLTNLVIPIKDKSQLKNLGYLTLIARKGDHKGGFFVSHRIDPKLGKILDEYYIY